MSEALSGAIVNQTKVAEDGRNRVWDKEETGAMGRKKYKEEMRVVRSRS